MIGYLIKYLPFRLLNELSAYHCSSNKQLRIMEHTQYTHIHTHIYTQNICVCQESKTYRADISLTGEFKISELVFCCCYFLLGRLPNLSLGWEAKNSGRGPFAIFPRFRGRVVSRYTTQFLVPDLFPWGYTFITNSPPSEYS